MSGARGVPAQDLPENQDEAVRTDTDQLTGKVTKLDKDGKRQEEPKSMEGADQRLVDSQPVETVPTNSDSKMKEKNVREAQEREAKEKEANHGPAKGDRK